MPWSNQQVPELIFSPSRGEAGGGDLSGHFPILSESNRTDGGAHFFGLDIQELVLEDTAV